MSPKHFIVYLPFLIIIVGFLAPIKPRTINIIFPDYISKIENLNLEKIISYKKQNLETKEIFLINKTYPIKSDSFTPPILSIISEDKSGRFCFLNGKIYKVGQSGENFTVLQIGDDYVILQTPIGRQTLYVKVP